jgi:hypothetical protein
MQYALKRLVPIEVPIVAKINWKELLLPFGKYLDKTMYYVYVNDFRYVEEYLATVDQMDVRMAALEAVEHKYRVDPYYTGRL